MFYYGQSFPSFLVRALFQAVLSMWQLLRCQSKRTPPLLSRFLTKIIQLLTKMKEKLLALLAKSREHALSEQKRIEETLAVIDYEIDCVKNSIETKND